jgi:hypothetical protein
MVPIYHESEQRVRAHFFVAALALLLTVDPSAEQALQALSTIRMVSFKVGASTSRIGVSVGSARARQVLKQATHSPEGGAGGRAVANPRIAPYYIRNQRALCGTRAGCAARSHLPPLQKQAIEEEKPAFGALHDFQCCTQVSTMAF